MKWQPHLATLQAEISRIKATIILKPLKDEDKVPRVDTITQNEAVNKVFNTYMSPVINAFRQYANGLEETSSLIIDKTRLN